MAIDLNAFKVILWIWQAIIHGMAIGQMVHQKKILESIVLSVIGLITLVLISLA